MPPTSSGRLILRWGEEVKIKNVPELFRERVERSYGKLAYKYKDKTGKWVEVTWGRDEKEGRFCCDPLNKGGNK